MKQRAIAFFFLLGFHTILFASPSKTITVQKNHVAEWHYQSAITYENPFQDVAISVKITNNKGKVIQLSGYWAGENEWRFRFSAPDTGAYLFITTCSDSLNSELHHQRGSIRVIPYNGSNSLYQSGTIRISDDKRHFEHLDGNPFFWLADSWWHGMTTRFQWPGDFQTLTADRKAKGFSVIQFALGHPCDIVPFDSRGQNEAGDPWLDSTFSCINPDYFELTDLRIHYLVKEGLLPNIMGTWGYYIKWAGVENMKKYWDYVIARYGAYPCTWMLTGEVTLAYYPDLENDWDKYKAQFRKQWSEVARHIKSHDPYHRLLTVHPGPGVFDGKPPLYDMTSLDFIMLQSGHAGFHTLPGATKNVQESLDLYPDKPVLHGEVCFEGMHGEGSGSKVQRFLFWSNMLMGTAGFSYGVEGIWQFNTKEVIFGASPGGNTWGNVPWEIASQYPGGIQIGIGKRILEQYEWWQLKPARELIHFPAGEGVFSPYCAIIGEIRFVYMYDFPTRWRRYTLVDLDPGILWQPIFVDPVTGDEYVIDTIKPDKDGQWDIPIPPIMQDWVLVVKPVK